MTRRPRSGMRLLALACSACIAAVHALQMELPGLSYYNTHPANTHFADPPPSSFSTLIPFHVPRLHSPAAYGPQSGFNDDHTEPAQGQAIPLMHEIFEGLRDEYLCGPLPPVLRVNQSVWRIADLPRVLELQSDFDASGLLVEDLSAPPRWPRLPLDLTVAGSILFASRGGSCSFAEKSYWAGKAGAAGLVVYGSLRPPDVLYTMGLLPSEFQSFLENHGESPANYTFPLPSVYVTAATFRDVCLLPFLDGIGKQSIWYRLGQQYLYPNGNPPTNSTGSSSGSNGAGLTGASSSGVSGNSTGNSTGSSTGNNTDSSSSAGTSVNLDSSTGDSSGGAESSSAVAVESSSSTAAARRLLFAALSPSSSVSADSESSSLSALLASTPPPTPASSLRVPMFTPPPSHVSKVLADPSSFDHTYELLADFAYLPLWGILDPASATAPGGVRIIEQVEYGGFRIAAYFLLVVPGIWILVAVIYAVRKCCQNKRAQKLRAMREDSLPVVTFKTIRAGSATMIAAGTKQTSKRMKTGSNPQRRELEGKEAEEAQQPQHLRYTHIDLDDSSAAAARPPPSMQHSEVAIHLSPAAAIALDEDEESPPQSPSARLASRTQLTNTASSIGNEHELAAPAPPSHVIDVAAAGASSSTPAPPLDQEVVGVGITARGQHIKLTGSTCAICLLDFSDGDQLKVLPCSHGFHPEGCINPWLEKSDECPVCRASISDALEVEPACCAWCCDPPRSAAQRFVDEQQQRDAVRQRQARREQAEEAERLAEMRGRDMEMMHLQPVFPHDGEGQQGAATIVAPSSSSSCAALSADDSEAMAARFHVEPLARCIADLFSTVRRLGLTPPAELVMLSDQMLQYASAARSGRMDDRAVGWLRRMLALMPGIHAKLLAARSEEAMDAAAVADSMMLFACDEIARARV